MGQLGQAPDSAKDGSFLLQQSVEGRKVDFVQTSNTLSGAITLFGAGDASLRDFGSFQVTLSITENGKIVQWDKFIGWNYGIFYIDAINAGNEYKIGGTLSRDQRSLEVSQIYQLFTSSPTPSIYSHIITYYWQNYGASSHTIYGSFQWKYVKTA